MILAVASSAAGRERLRRLRGWAGAGARLGATVVVVVVVVDVLVDVVELVDGGAVVVVVGGCAVVGGVGVLVEVGCSVAIPGIAAAVGPEPRGAGRARRGVRRGERSRPSEVPPECPGAVVSLVTGAGVSVAVVAGRSSATVSAGCECSCVDTSALGLAAGASSERVPTATITPTTPATATSPAAAMRMRLRRRRRRSIARSVREWERSFSGRSSMASYNVARSSGSSSSTAPAVVPTISRSVCAAIVFSPFRPGPGARDTTPLPPSRNPGSSCPRATGLGIAVDGATWVQFSRVSARACVPVSGRSQC